MLTVAILFLVTPVLLLVVALVGAWVEARRSPYPFGIGRVISNGFGAIGGAPFALLIASAVLNAPVQFATPFATQVFLASGGVNAASAAFAPLGILWLLVYPFVQLFMIGIALDTLAGRPVDIAVTLRMALRRMLPGLALIVLAGIGTMVGFMLLVVPALILLLTWFVVLPVLAGEGRGIFECFSRSAELMRGMRWRLLLLLVVVGVLWLIVSAAVQTVALAVGGIGNLWLQAGVRAVFATLTGMVPATGAAAVYHEARIAKEGTGSHDLQAVFA